MTANPYLQSQYFNPAKPNAVAAVDGQIPQQKPITYGGMVPVSSIEEVLKYPVQFYKRAMEIPAPLQILHDEVKRMILDTIKQAEEKERQNEIGGNVQNRSD